MIRTVRRFAFIILVTLCACTAIGPDCPREGGIGGTGGSGTVCAPPTQAE